MGLFPRDSGDVRGLSGDGQVMVKVTGEIRQVTSPPLALPGGSAQAGSQVNRWEQRWLHWCLPSVHTFKVTFTDLHAPSHQDGSGSPLPTEPSVTSGQVVHWWCPPPQKEHTIKHKRGPVGRDPDSRKPANVHIDHDTPINHQSRQKEIWDFAFLFKQIS